MIQDFKTSEKAPYRIVGRELLACLAWGAIYPFGIAGSPRRTPRREQLRTVVFVHGYLANRASFFPLATYLRLHGVKETLSFNYKSAGGIEKGAKELREFLGRHVRGGRIDLVCHSLGGIIAQLYIQELGGSRRVDRCINLGTPHKGTYSSYWVSSKVGRDLRPDSEIMKRLSQTQEKASSVKFSSIVGGADNIVIPRVFAADGLDVVHVADVGHVGLLFSPTVFFEVTKRLQA